MLNTIYTFTTSKNSEKLADAALQVIDTCEYQGSMWAKKQVSIWSEWRLTVIAATVRIALVDILDLSEVVIPTGVFYTLQWAGAEDGEGIRPAAGTGNE